MLKPARTTRVAGGGGAGGAGRGPVLPLRAAVPVAVGGGLLTYLAFPGHDLWPLAPLGLAALVVATSGRRAGSAALVGLVQGLALCLPLLSWAGVYLGPIAWLPLSVACALFTAAAGAGLAAVSGLPGGAVPRSLAAGGVWVALEGLLARWPFGGFGWPRVAFSQAGAPTLGLAALGGAPLVSFAVATCGALLAAALVRATGGRGASPGGAGRGRRGVAVPLVAAALAVEVCGALVPRPTTAQAGTLRVAAVQGNVPRAGLDFNAQRRAVLDDHARVTAQLVSQVAAGRRPAPQLVVWPENSSDIDPFRNPDAYDEIQAATDAVRAPLLMGAVLVRADERTLSNTSLLWQPGRGPVAAYDKRHPVPFAEYIPHRAFFRRITSAVDLVSADFVAGHRVGRIDAAGARLGVMICFEVVEDGLVSDTVDRGADLLVVQTNNATFGHTDESAQQLAMSRLRAVEHGRAVVHVSTVGQSALVMPDGTLLQRTGLFTPALLQHALPLRTSATVADRLRRAGLDVEGLLAGLGVAGAAAGALTGLRSRRLT